MPVACVHVPGETTASRLQQREVRDRLMTMARTVDPQCRNPQITGTEILDVHRDGRSAEELWTVDQCGRRLRYVVTFPVKPSAPHHFSVREDR
jgi:hypothetical protein